MRTIDQMIQSEVLCCMSHIVATLAGGYGRITHNNRSRAEAISEGLPSLCEQAFELASPIPDYEEAAIQAGWSPHKRGDAFAHESGDMSESSPEDANGWENLCNEYGIDPYDHEVFEHWAVTDWFADKLLEAGEKVDKDFGNLCIWARTTSGQAISMDGVVERIYAKTHQKEEA